MGTVMRRPSNSGMATFMAVSKGFRPRPDDSHGPRAMPLVMACSTGTSSCCNAATDQPALVGPSGFTSLIANDTVLTSTSISGPFSSRKKSKASGQPEAASTALSEAVYTGNTLTFRLSSSRTSASTKAVLPLIQCAR